MTWADVDIEHSQIHIRAKDDWRPKTGDERSVAMSPAARAVLEALPRHGRWVVTMPPTPTYPQRGRQLSDRWLLGQFKRILKGLGLEGHLHTFCHSFISDALNRNVPEPVVREWVGHVDREIIRHYTHVAESISQDAMRRLAEARQSDGAQEPPKAS